MRKPDSLFELSAQVRFAVLPVVMLADRFDGAAVPPPVTVTWAVPLTAPLVAVTVWGPPAVPPAVKRPAVSMVPPPETIQVKLGWLVSAVVNWSCAVAVNCWVAFVATLALAGATTMLVSVWETVMVTGDVTVR